MSNTLELKPGSRLRTGGATYEVTDDASIPAGIVPVIPQPTRLLKVFCEACGYTARVTQRWISKLGTPICPCGHGAMAVEAVPVVAPPPIKAKPVVKAKPKPQPKAEEAEESPLAAELAELPEPAPAVEGVSTLAQLLADL